MTYDLYIRCAAEGPDIDSEPIGRHRWLDLAVSTPALMLQQRDSEGSVDHDVDFPAFTLLGHFNRPTLFWRNGSVVVR